ncbi:MAG: NosD domain-containing protein, partial [Promethearchaeota archaeon]
MDRRRNLQGTMAIGWYRGSGSEPLISFDGNEEMDAFFAANGSDGLLFETAHEFTGLDFYLEQDRSTISIVNTTRFLVIKDCRFLGNIQNATAAVIIISNSSNIMIENCFFYNISVSCILIENNSANITIKATEFIGNYCGLQFKGNNVGNLNVVSNAFQENTYSIKSEENKYLIITGNDFRYNNFGISFKKEMYHEITENVFKDNRNGVVFGVDCWYSTIWNNYFAGDTQVHAFDGDENNNWDNGSWGNYWSDLKEKYPSATNSGRFWDTSYLVCYYFGGSVIDQHPLIVCNYPLVDFEANPQNASINAGIQFIYTGIHEGDDASFNWDFGDGSTNSTGESPTHAYSSAGDYSVTLSVEDCNGHTRTFKRTSYIHVAIDNEPG